MPYIFSTRFEYKNADYQIDFKDAVNRFPNIASKIVSGEILAAYVENKVTTIKKPFKCKVSQIQEHPDWIGRVIDLNPLKDKGLPPCELCVALYKYEEFVGRDTIEFPIMESEVIKSSTWSYFDEIVKRISKEEEIRIIIETTAFHPEVKVLAQNLRDAYISFEEERYAHTKTSCRKVMENLKNRSKNWKTIDGSKSLCEKFKPILSSIYSFASTGGPHEGINTREETEFILKAVASVFFYINNLLKSDRIIVNTTQNGNDSQSQTNPIIDISRKSE